MNIRKKTLTLSISVLLLLSLVTGCGTSSSTAVSGSIASNQTEKAPSQPAATVPETESETEPEPSTEYIAPVTANIVAVGDMLMHGGVSVPAVQADGTYNYDYVFANVKDAVNAETLPPPEVRTAHSLRHSTARLSGMPTRSWTHSTALSRRAQA